MKLYITEKKTVAEAFAPVLGKKSLGAGGLSFVTNNGDVVTWLSGHVLELIDAKDIDPKYAKWDLDTLPILPEPFVLRPPADRVTPLGVQNNGHKRKILNNVLSLISKADTVCLATDPDAEGELLGREVIEYSGFTGKLTRILPTSLEVNDIKKTIASEFPAEKTELVGKAGLARSHIDWIVGINTTRGLTAFNSSKISRPLNAGRVQTAIVKVLHLNHMARENFKPQPIYNVKANAYVNGSLLNLNYQPTAAERTILDAKDEEYDSIKSKELVNQLAAKLNGKDGIVKKCEKVRKQEACPKGYSLSDLQIDINNKFGINASEVLEATQSLYDKKYVTYPRTDNNYFPEDAHSYAPTILGNIGELNFMSGITGIDTSIKNSYWDTSKFDNHHAILPTRMKAPYDSLTPNEKVVYEMVCRRYVMQFLPNYQFDSTTILVDIDGSEFKTSGKIPVIDGWKLAVRGRGTKGTDGSDEDEEDGQENEGKSLPLVEKGTTTTDTKVFTTEGVTKIMPLYTEGKLLQVLKNPAKFIDSKELKNILKERDKGIGRESTRATILQQMLVNGFYAVQGKKNFALTDKGIMMAEIAPPMLLDLALTAKLELAFWQIEKGELTYDELMSEYKNSTQEIIKSIRRGECKLNKYLVKHTKCPVCNSGTMVQKQGKDKNNYWRCDDCNASANDVNGKPVPRAQAEQCPKCSNKTLSRFLFKGTENDYAWYCKPCTLIVSENEKKPNIKLNTCQKCNNHVNFGYSAPKKIAYWRCSDRNCNTFYADNNGEMGAMKQNSQSGGGQKTAPCPKCNGTLKQFSRNSDQKKFWLCSNRNVEKIQCQASYEDDNDQPITKILEVDCPSCKTGILTRKEFHGRHFWGCSNFNNSKKQCKFSAKDNNGEPVLLLNN